MHKYRITREVVLITLMVVLFLGGVALMLYPYVRGAIVDRRIASNAESCLSWAETLSFDHPSEPDKTSDSILPEGIISEETESERSYADLWDDMVAYNQSIYDQGQAGLTCEYAYQKPSFLLCAYGLKDETFGVISIPAMDLEMP